jgi:serine/threonine protein kinase
MDALKEYLSPSGAVFVSFFELPVCAIVFVSRVEREPFATCHLLMKELFLHNCRLDKRYDVFDHLGRGSYAEIFLAKDTLASPQSPHRQVVIKALNVFLQDDLDADLERTLVENFQNEAVALDRVRHPNIISRIGHGTARDLRGAVFHYLVLEYLAGGDLQNRMRRQKVPLQQALGYIEQTCAGLGHAHSRGIIHRDIKPQNILLTADFSTVKIADFGVARFSAADSPITKVGTNIYAPPEHSPLTIRRDGVEARLTPAADIYSLAKTIHTLLTGESPRAFANEAITSLPDTVREEEWAEDLLRVLKRATDDEPSMRQQSVEELWADLATVRQIAADGEFSTLLRSDLAAPQAHVSRGYTPITPALPQFEQIAETSPVYVPPVYDPLKHPAMPAKNDLRPPAAQNAGFRAPVTTAPTANPAAVPKRKRRTLRRFAVFAVSAVLFTGALYGTASYMRGRGGLPAITNPFRTQTAIANTDIYLRPTPNTENEPIGLVTKNSRVKIVNSQNNWYQVDVVEQGRVRPVAANSTRGWLNGKYLEFTSN